MHTGLVTIDRRIWLTPATAVLAVAICATAAAVSWGIGRHIRAKATPAAASATVPTQPTYTVAGKVHLRAGQYVHDGQGCGKPDAQVVVTDTTGASLAYTPLQPGQLTGGACVAPFILTIPAGHGTYSVDVPTVGRLDYTEDELRDLVELAIG